MSIEQQVTETLTSFLQAFSHLQLEEMMKYFSNDTTAYLPVHHRINLHKGKNEISEYFKWVHDRVRASGVTDMKLVAEDILIQLPGDVVVVTFKIIENDVLRRTVVLKKTDDSWQIIHIHASNAPIK